MEIADGSVSINSLITYKELSAVGLDFQWTPFLNGKEYVKFVIKDLESDEPKMYFANSEKYKIHKEFIDGTGLGWLNEQIVKGEIGYHPTVVSNNGTLGEFSFNFSVGLGQPFDIVQQVHELIAANMPFLKNNLSYFITEFSEVDYLEEKSDFDNSRIPVLFESDLYADIDFLALNVAEGYGFFRLMDLSETPSSRDVVLYESLPNTLPRVGGIMTSVIQTPLSHVNLRAIQDNLPNAFIREPLAIDSIANLLGKYVYYKVDQGQYYIREATLEEVNQWFEDIRPEEEQVPELNLSYTSILPLEEIEFGMSDGFGAKCANIATMQTFGFPEGTIPDGFGVPFYYYQEFMKFNGFFERIEEMLADPLFQSDLNERIDILKEFRKDIKDADMPQWMLDELQEMHESFPEGTSIRCRSSTNIEDLPGFSGAGLYTSKTQHPDEGHISKSIKQVYASMWNFRAFDERDFYRADQYIASMGVLCHPNFSNEKANGVGVSTDPIYQTENTFYLNTQIGEDLVTNPEALSVPEEILLDRIAATDDDYIVIRYSNLQPDDELIMDEQYLDEIREYLSVIHDEFQKLYHAEGNDLFAMDIEYKITSEDQLVIKQARPWASFWSDLGTSTADEGVLEGLQLYPNPTSEYLKVNCDCDLRAISIYDLDGQQRLHDEVRKEELPFQISMTTLNPGFYSLQGVGKNGSVIFTQKFIKY